MYFAEMFDTVVARTYCLYYVLNVCNRHMTRPTYAVKN